MQIHDRVVVTGPAGSQQRGLHGVVVDAVRTVALPRKQRGRKKVHVQHVSAVTVRLDGETRNRSFYTQDLAPEDTDVPHRPT